MYVSLIFSFIALLSLGRAQVACDLRRLYSRLATDVVLAEAFCTEFLQGSMVSRDFTHQFGSNCEAYRAELSIGCSIFTTAKEILQPTTPAVTVTMSEPATTADFCNPSVVTVTVTQSQSQAHSVETASASPQALAPHVHQIPLGMDMEDSGDHAARDSSTLTSITPSTFSSMTTASLFRPLSSSLSTTMSTVYRTSISSLATPVSTATGRYIPSPLPSVIDRHVFSPLGDLSFDESSSSVTGAMTVNDFDDSNPEAVTTFTMVSFPDAAANTCVHLTGSWTPVYTNVVYECVSRTRAPGFNPQNYPSAFTALSFTTDDGSSSIANSRPFGPEPEGDYEELSLDLFVSQDHTYTVDFWACGPGTSLAIGELSCTYYG
ncbi:hypothetical protein LTR96_007726 [Exophiala xenobiotica]|nr:hypothetical protein LTR96_007726 [Exophiala xenobiotica]